MSVLLAPGTLVGGTQNAFANASAWYLRDSLNARASSETTAVGTFGLQDVGMVVCVAKDMWEDTKLLVVNCRGELGWILASRVKVFT